MKRSDFIFESVNLTEVYDAKTSRYLGEIEGILPSDINEMSDDEFNAMIIENHIKN